MTTNAQPFLFLFRDSRPEIYASLSEAGRRELVAQWTAWVDGLMQQGKMQSGYPLHLQGCVVSGDRGEILTDGPYAESKEAVAGYFLLSVADKAEAVAIARECPSLSFGLSVEVRPIAEFSPALKELRGRGGNRES